MPTRGGPTRPERRVFGADDAGSGAGLGQGVALEHGQPGSVEPGRDVLGDGRAARDEEADPPAEPGADLRQHKPVGQRMLGLNHTARLTALQPGLRDLVAHAEGPGEQPVSDPALFLHCLHDLRAYLLEDPWGTRHEGRPNCREVLHDLVDAAVDGGGEADLQLHGRQHLAERVRERQPQVLQVATERMSMASAPAPM